MVLKTSDGHDVILSLVKKRRKRCNWDDNETHEIFAQTCNPGVSVSRIACHYDANANFIFE